MSAYAYSPKLFEEIENTNAVSIPATPPTIRLPCCPMPLKGIDLPPLSRKAVELVVNVEICAKIVAKLQREKVIAMAVEGINIGKEGPLTLIQISTFSGHVFVFDILENRDLMKKGRISHLLEDSNVLKVIHDCSNVSAALNFQFAVTLTYVFDTQVAHLLISEHKGRRLPSGMNVFDICMQYSDDVEKLYTYDWRTDSKKVWTSSIGNFWALRPLTSDMVEFAIADVIVLIPDVYRHQLDYIGRHGLCKQLETRAEEWLQIEIDDVVKEKRGKRISKVVETILYEIHSNNDDKVELFNILDPDEINALALSTYEDAAKISERVRTLKKNQILADIRDLELDLRMEEESWEKRNNVFDYLSYYMQIPDSDIKTKAVDVWNVMFRAVIGHTEKKYNTETTPNMLTSTEREALRLIPYTEIESNELGHVVSSLYWKSIHEEIHGRINFLRFCPNQFSLTAKEYEKIVHFATGTSNATEDVVGLANGLLHAIRASSASTGKYKICERRKEAST